MQTIQTLAILGLLPSALLAAPFQDTETFALEKRQTGTNILATFLSKEFAKVFGTTPVCCDTITDGACWAAGSAKGAQYPWELCYTPGDQKYSAEDAAVVNCLTNLHYTQSDTCISVQGSSCDLNNYIANGGRVQNTKLSWIGAHNKLNSDQSRAIQAASNAFIGTSAVTSKIHGNNNGPIFSPTSPTNGLEEVNMYVMYIGEDAC